MRINTKKILRKISAVIVLTLILTGVVHGDMQKVVAATTHNQSEAVEWANSKIGQSLDYDGVWGAQCVDLIAYYYAYLGTTTPGGNAIDYASNKLPTGWIRVYGNYQPGDIAVWYANHSCNICVTGQYGHVAIITSADSSWVNVVDQNGPSNKGYCKANSYPVSAIKCAIRPDFSNSGSTQTSIFTNATAESITESGARIKADMDSVRYLSTAGVYFGTDPSNMQKITENVNGNAQGLFYDTAKWIGTLQSNTTYWYQLYVVTGGNEYKTDLKSFTTTSVWTDAYTEGITETNAVIKGTTNNNKYVTTAGIYIGTDASNMHKVVENVNADAKWYVYDLNKWYGILKPGTTYVYQLYTVYDGVEHKSNLNSFTTADNTAPVISSVEVTDVSSTGYTISCVVSDNGNVACVCFPTWTEANGQDDIDSDWYNNTAVYTPDANGRYSFRVNTSDHNYESGKYITLICAYDGAGNNTWAGGECTIYPLQSITLSLASQSLTVGEQFTLSVSYYPTDTTDDKSVAWTTSNSNVATVNNGTVQAVGVGTATITATAAGKSASCIVTVKEKASKPDSGTADDSGTTGGSGSMGDSDSPSIPYNGWYTKNGKSYWYENGVRQGYDPNNAAYRGKEIYDPGSDAWYWLDNVQQGAKAVSKDVYQESSGGKWVRYDENGHMIKGWQTNNEGTYYFDPVTGAMAKGNVMIDGTVYSFDVNTGILQSTGTTIQNGWLRMDGKDYWYENGVRQGYDPNNPSYRGKEIYDPGTDAWYWLDNVQQGAKAVSKDVYQESYSAYPDRADGTGKWVRYDENGHMVKGWQTTEAGTYYFETITGSMAKGCVTIDGVNYYFDPITGVKQ